MMVMMMHDDDDDNGANDDAVGCSASVRVRCSAPAL